MQKHNKIIAALICLIFLASFLSFQYGVYVGAIQALKIGAELGLSLLKVQGINISLDANQIAHGIWQYQNQVDLCYSPGRLNNGTQRLQDNSS